MVLRADSVQARLRRLEEVVTELRELAKLDRAALRGSLRNMWAVARGLQLGAEILLDIGNHILSAAAFPGTAGVSPACPEESAERRQLSPALC